MRGICAVGAVAPVTHFRRRYIPPVSVGHFGGQTAAGRLAPRDASKSGNLSLAYLFFFTATAKCTWPASSTKLTAQPLLPRPQASPSRDSVADAKANASPDGAQLTAPTGAVSVLSSPCFCLYKPVKLWYKYHTH